MEAHEYASIFPMLPETELQQLAADIKQNGLNNPIIKLDGKILDGRNRYAACKIAGIRPVFDEYQGDDPLAYVISQNLKRRHLSETQRGMAAARIADLVGGRPSETSPIGGVSRKQAAQMLNVGTGTVDRARAVLNHGVPELAAMTERDEITVNAAAQVAKLPHDEQRAVVEKGPDAVKEAARTVAPAQPAPMSPQPSKRLPVLEINNADEIATQARVTLDRIMTKDKGRVAALHSIIAYCQNRITSNK